MSAVRCPQFAVRSPHARVFHLTITSRYKNSGFKISQFNSKGCLTSDFTKISNMSYSHHFRLRQRKLYLKWPKDKTISTHDQITSVMTNLHKKRMLKLIPSAIRIIKQIEKIEVRSMDKDNGECKQLHA